MYVYTLIVELFRHPIKQKSLASLRDPFPNLMSNSKFDGIKMKDYYENE